MEDNDKITFQGAADEVPGLDPGDIIVVIRILKNDEEKNLPYTSSPGNINFN
jgi:DnaJ-class molecular chaperone